MMTWIRDALGSWEAASGQPPQPLEMVPEPEPAWWASTQAGTASTAATGGAVFQ
jgi:hypothetical protein